MGLLAIERACKDVTSWRILAIAWTATILGRARRGSSGGHRAGDSAHGSTHEPYLPTAIEQILRRSQTRRSRMSVPQGQRGMTSVSCKRTFRDKAHELGIGESEFLLLKARKIRTMEQLASVTDNKDDKRRLLKWMSSREAVRDVDTRKVQIVDKPDLEGVEKEEAEDIAADWITDPTLGGLVNRLVQLAHVMVETELKAAQTGTQVVKIDPPRKIALFEGSDRHEARQQTPSRRRAALAVCTGKRSRAHA